ncbi:hypothetical protein HY389_00135 [Candidatus Daviesbacteria bacterium]|nr:hypothetical protein [Candidatus Daviesbacteria bacterium]
MPKTKAQKQRNLKIELVTQLLTLSTSGFGLVAALAWNDTIQQVVKEFIEPRIPGSGILSRLIYAVLVTVLAVLITYQLSKLMSHLQGKS